jgi:hypothetical protein
MSDHLNGNVYVSDCQFLVNSSPEKVVSAVQLVKVINYIIYIICLMKFKIVPFQFTIM